MPMSVSGGVSLKPGMVKFGMQALVARQGVGFAAELPVRPESVDPEATVDDAVGHAVLLGW